VLAPGRRSLAGISLLAALLAAAGCTSSPEPSPEPSAEPSAGPSPSASPSTSTPQPPTAPSASPSASRTPRPDPVSLPALFVKRYDGRALALRRTIARTDAYTSYSVTYRSNGLRISGKLDVPTGRGPFPAVVLAHGYIDPAVYVNGQGMRREQDWLARAGYLVLHTDYRNHAYSDVAPDAERHLRLGYTTDVVNAVHALRRMTKVPVDDDRIGLVGRSMGGGVVYNVLVAQPGLVDAAVVHAPVSSRTWDNFDRWIRADPGRSELSDYILRRYGDPAASPRFWRGISPRTYFDRITEPVLIQHGTADESCPIRWSRETLAAMRRAGVDAKMVTYPGEPHAFIADWPLSMRRTTAFLRRHLVS
jgi:dipeptidyl aminopeptidase/acylaminoacyl peptidase